MTATQDELIAELQRANAALRERLDAASAQRGSGYAEQAAHQAATIDVLKVMSSTPDDTQPVFDLIVRRAKELCNSNTAALFQLRDGLVHFGALYSDLDWDTPAFASYLAQYPMPPTRESLPSADRFSTARSFTSRTSRPNPVCLRPRGRWSMRGFTDRWW